MDVDRPGIDEKFSAPDTIDELIAPKRSPILCGQHPEELKLLSAQPEVMLTNLDLKANPVNA